MIRMRIARWVGLSLAAHAVAGGALFWAGPEKAVVDRPSGVMYVMLVEHPAMEVEIPAQFIAPRRRPTTDESVLPPDQPAPPTAASEHPATDTSDFVIDPNVEAPDVALPSERDEPDADGNDSAAESVAESHAAPVSAPPSNGTDYRAVVVAAIERVKRYPELARTRDMEGTVQIAFTIHPDGRLSDPEVVVPSRYALLNHAALALVRRMRSVPPPPSTAPLRFPASIQYRLPDDSDP